MKPQYLPSVVQMHDEYYNGRIKTDKVKLLIKKNEVEPLRKLCDLISMNISNSFRILDGYYVGYCIPQISNEFDLLRFGTNYIVNIEIKSSMLSEERKIDVITAQMKKQYYYLKFLEKELHLYTYIENDGFYHYDSKSDRVDCVDVRNVVSSLINQQVDYDMDPNDSFKPSNYFVSPFNKVERFVSDEYFLTPDQATKKKNILDSIQKNEYLFYSIFADAGTGKTLLTYDIAKTLQKEGESVLILHCATLNDGQRILNEKYDWNIKSVGIFKVMEVEKVVGHPYLIVVDEAHRIRKNQLDELVEYAFKNKIMMIFSYDTKQYLRKNEERDIHQYLINRYPSNTSCLRKLTTKIRTNKRIASFINNMMIIGSSKDNLDYKDITIEYFNSEEDAKNYLNYLEKATGWKAITFTPSQYNKEPVDSLSALCSEKAHGVIGQEFEKVVFAMDSNFKYSDNKLLGRVNYYNLKGMLYQIVTRAVNELKIIVINNPELYEKLMLIKCMGEGEK